MTSRHTRTLKGVPEDTPQCSYEAVHCFMPISDCSNVPGFMDPTCFVSEGDSRNAVGRFVDYMLLIAGSAKKNMQHKFRLDQEKVRDVFDRTEKVEVLERIQELVGSPKGIWESRNVMRKIEIEFDRYLPHCKTLPKIKCGFHWEFSNSVLLTLLNLAGRLIGLIQARPHCCAFCLHNPCSNYNAWINYLTVNAVPL